MQPVGTRSYQLPTLIVTKFLNNQRSGGITSAKGERLLLSPAFFGATNRWLSVGRIATSFLLSIGHFAEMKVGSYNNLPC